MLSAKLNKGKKHHRQDDHDGIAVYVHKEAGKGICSPIFSN